MSAIPARRRGSRLVPLLGITSEQLAQAIDRKVKLIARLERERQSLTRRLERARIEKAQLLRMANPTGRRKSLPHPETRV